jgi:hypothetical protein
MRVAQVSRSGRRDLVAVRASRRNPETVETFVMRILLWPAPSLALFERRSAGLVQVEPPRGPSGPRRERPGLGRVLAHAGSWEKRGHVRPPVSSHSWPRHYLAGRVPPPASTARGRIHLRHHGCSADTERGVSARPHRLRPRHLLDPLAKLVLGLSHRAGDRVRHSALQGLPDLLLWCERHRGSGRRRDFSG